MPREAIRSRTNLVAAVLVLALGFGGVALAQRSSGTNDVNITLLDGRLTVVPTTLRAGKITLVIANRGRVSHAFAIMGTNLQRKGTSELASGKTVTLTVTLKVGSYRVWDPAHSSVSHAKTVKVTARKTSATSPSAYGQQSTWGSSTGSKPSSGATSGSQPSSSGTPAGSATGADMAGVGCGH